MFEKGNADPIIDQNLKYSGPKEQPETFMTIV